MHTLSMHARQTARWRWLTFALVVIVAQFTIAVIVRSDAANDGRTSGSANANGRGITPRP